MTSPGHKVGQFLKLMYPHQYGSHKAQNIEKINGYLAGIFNLRYCIWQKGFRDLTMASNLKMLKYHTQLQFDLRYEKIVPNYAIVLFMVVTSSMTQRGGLKVALYIPAWESLALGAGCKGHVSSINPNIAIVFVGYTCLKRISVNNIFEIAGQRSTLKA